jgi:hypothetical protein
MAFERERGLRPFPTRIGSSHSVTALSVKKALMVGGGLYLFAKDPASGDARCTHPVKMQRRNPAAALRRREVNE